MGQSSQAHAYARSNEEVAARRMARAYWHVLPGALHALSGAAWFAGSASPYIRKQSQHLQKCSASVSVCREVGNPWLCSWKALCSNTACGSLDPLMNQPPNAGPGRRSEQREHRTNRYIAVHISVTADTFLKGQYPPVHNCHEFNSSRTTPLYRHQLVRWISIGPSRRSARAC